MFANRVPTEQNYILYKLYEFFLEVFVEDLFDTFYELILHSIIPYRHLDMPINITMPASRHLPAKVNPLMTSEIPSCKTMRQSRTRFENQN